MEEKFIQNNKKDNENDDKHNDGNGNKPDVAPPKYPVTDRHAEDGGPAHDDKRQSADDSEGSQSYDNRRNSYFRSQHTIQIAA